MLNEERFRFFIDSYPSPFAILSPLISNNAIEDFIFEYANEAVCISYNVPKEYLTGKKLLDIFPRHRTNNVFENLSSVYRTGNPFSQSFSAWSGEKKVLYKISASKIADYIIAGWVELSEAENIESVDAGLFSSIREKDLLLKEKDLLIRESHHRIKNNLQLVNSLVRLQSQNNDKSFDNFLKALENKIQSISLLHDHLYKNKSLSYIGMKGYITGLIEHLLSSHDKKNINIITELDEVEMKTESAGSIGLIINELVANSIKHAFPVNTPGTIKIKLKQGNKTFLSVSDDGRGIEHSSQQEYSGSGFQLILTLVEQLNGNMVIKNSMGTTVEITI